MVAQRCIPALRLHSSRAELLVSPGAAALAQPLKGAYLVQPGFADAAGHAAPVYLDLPPAFREFRYTCVVWLLLLLCRFHRFRATSCCANQHLP